MNRYILIRRLTGPAILLLIGIIALLHQADLVSWNHDPARVEAVLRLSGHTREGLNLAHVMMRW